MLPCIVGRQGGGEAEEDCLHQGQQDEQRKRGKPEMPHPSRSRVAATKAQTTASTIRKYSVARAAAWP
jgi:hypothetical protein